MNVNLKAKTTIYNPTYITFKNNLLYSTNDAIYIQYRLKQSEEGENSSTCHLSSEICNFKFVLENQGGGGSICNIPYCRYCDGVNCAQCESIDGIYLNKDINSCVCDVKKGFRLYPLEKIDKTMCVCKKGYSFYICCFENIIPSKLEDTNSL